MTSILHLNFHGVGRPPAGIPQAAADTWIELDRLRRILDRVRDEPNVRITFDDGYASDREHALGELRDRGLTATFFVVLDTLDGPGHLATGDVAALVAAGMRVGSHGMNHVRWRGLPAAGLAHELGESREILRRLAGVDVTEAACPFGAYDRTVIRGARRAGYAGLYTSDGGFARRGEFVQPRTSMRAWDDAASVDRLLAPHAGERVRRRATRWLRSRR